MGAAAAGIEARFRAYLRSELENATIYRIMAEREKDDERSLAFKRMSAAEMDHAWHWAKKLEIDRSSLKPSVTFRTRVLSLLAKRISTRALLPFVLRREFAEIRAYAKEPEAKEIIDEERHHAILIHSLVSDGSPLDLIQSEGRYRVGSASNIRAATLGFNDGLVAVFALIMGVAGGTSDHHIIVLAGVAGLLAGGFSMAAGEYLSVRVQCDVYEREVEIERAEIKEAPEREKEELQIIYKQKGLTVDEAKAVSDRIMRNTETALDTMAREELGLDPSQMGSPWGVAISSITAFALGALIPLSPFFFTSGALAMAICGVGSAIAAMVVGGTLSSLSGKSVIWGSARMLLIGAASAGVTFTIGRILGVTVA